MSCTENASELAILAAAEVAAAADAATERSVAETHRNSCTCTVIGSPREERSVASSPPESRLVAAADTSLDKGQDTCAGDADAAGDTDVAVAQQEVADEIEKPASAEISAQIIESVNSASRAACQDFAGKWCYGKGQKFKYTLTSNERGQWRFTEHAHGHARAGVLKQQDGWLMGQVSLLNGELLGFIRMRKGAEDSTIVSNFRSTAFTCNGAPAPWGDDIIAFREPACVVAVSRDLDSYVCDSIASTQDASKRDNAVGTKAALDAATKICENDVVPLECVRALLNEHHGFVIRELEHWVVNQEQKLSAFITTAVQDLALARGPFPIAAPSLHESSEIEHGAGTLAKATMQSKALDDLPAVRKDGAGKHLMCEDCAKTLAAFAQKITSEWPALTSKSSVATSSVEVVVPTVEVQIPLSRSPSPGSSICEVLEGSMPNQLPESPPKSASNANIVAASAHARSSLASSPPKSGLLRSRTAMPELEALAKTRSNSGLPEEDEHVREPQVKTRNSLLHVLEKQIKAAEGKTIPSSKKKKKKVMVQVNADDDEHDPDASAHDSTELDHALSMVDSHVDRHVFALSDVWKKRRTMQNQLTFTTQRPVHHGGGDTDMSEFIVKAYSEDQGPNEAEHMSKNPCWNLVVIHPNSARRGGWDSLSLILVLYDLVVIPLQLLDPPENTFFKALAWTARIFWTVDMPMTFITGFLTPNGMIELRPRPIARRYLKTWFSMDGMLLALDWMELVTGVVTELGFVRITKTGRSFRILRMMRLLRLFRMREVVRLFSERVQSERFAIMADLGMIVGICMGWSHLIACIWWGVGVMDGFNGNNWVTKHGYDTQEFSYRYCTSLHWSLSQFAGGMDEVTPHNTNERIFAIAIFLLAFIMASVFVSSLTSSMTKLHIITSGQSQKLATLRKYLSQNRISNKLSMRIYRNATQGLLEKQRSVLESNVELMATISDALRMELHFEMYGPLLGHHPFFLRYMENCPQVMRKVCHHATQILDVCQGVTIFEAGETPPEPKMYIVKSGVLQYVSISGMVSEVRENDWIAEATLWTNWMHLGRVKADSDCRMCVINANIFQGIVAQFDHPDFDPALYARAFVEDLNAVDAAISDLSHHRTNCDTATSKWLANSELWNNKRGRHQKSAASPWTMGWLGGDREPNEGSLDKGDGVARSPSKEAATSNFSQHEKTQDRGSVCTVCTMEGYPSEAAMTRDSS